MSAVEDDWLYDEGSDKPRVCRRCKKKRHRSEPPEYLQFRTCHPCRILERSGGRKSSKKLSAEPRQKRLATLKTEKPDFKRDFRKATNGSDNFKIIKNVPMALPPHLMGPNNPSLTPFQGLAGPSVSPAATFKLFDKAKQYYTNPYPNAKPPTAQIPDASKSKGGSMFFSRPHVKDDLRITKNFSGPHPDMYKCIYCERPMDPSESRMCRNCYARSRDDPSRYFFSEFLKIVSKNKEMDINRLLFHQSVSLTDLINGNMKKELLPVPVISPVQNHNLNDTTGSIPGSNGNKMDSSKVMDSNYLDEDVGDLATDTYDLMDISNKGVQKSSITDQVILTHFNAKILEKISQRIYKHFLIPLMASSGYEFTLTNSNMTKEFPFARIFEESFRCTLDSSVSKFTQDEIDPSLFDKPGDDPVETEEYKLSASCSSEVYISYDLFTNEIFVRYTHNKH